MLVLSLLDGRLPEWKKNGRGKKTKREVNIQERIQTRPRLPYPRENLPHVILQVLGGAKSR